VPKQPLFAVYKGSADPHAVLNVTVDDEAYHIDGGDDYNTTMNVLTLSQLVIGAQKQGTAIAPVVPVQVINP
jgi:hypothetical protein